MARYEMRYSQSSSITSSFQSTSYLNTSELCSRNSRIVFSSSLSSDDSSQGDFSIAPADKGVLLSTMPASIPVYESHDYYHSSHSRVGYSFQDLESVAERSSNASSSVSHAVSSSASSRVSSPSPVNRSNSGCPVKSSQWEEIQSSPQSSLQSVQSKPVPVLCQSSSLRMLQLAYEDASSEDEEESQKLEGSSVSSSSHSLSFISFPVMNVLSTCTDVAASNPPRLSICSGFESPLVEVDNKSKSPTSLRTAEDPDGDGKQGRQRREAVAPSPLFYSRSLQPQPPIRWRIWSGGGCGSVGEELENKGLCSSRRRTRPSNSIPQPHNSRRSSHPIIKEEECSMLKEESDELLHSLGMPDQEELEDEPVNNSGQISPVTDQETAKNPKHVDFPFLLASTDKGNVMLVTESVTPGFRHHWSLHSRRPQKEEGQFLERFACINCKKLSRQTQSSSFAPCLTLMVQQANKEIHLLNHPWTSTRTHLCSGVHIDVSDACVLVRQKRRQITYSDSDPKLGYDQIMQEIDTNPNWSVAKKKAVKMQSQRQDNKSQSKQGPSNCSILDGDFSFEQFNHGYFDRQHQQLLNESVLQESQKGAEQLSANQMLQQWAEETGMDISIDMQSACPVVDTSSNHTTHDLHSNHEPTNNNNTAEYPMDQESEVDFTSNINFDSTNGSASSYRSSELREQKRENKNKSKKSIRQIDFSLYPQRRIALLFLYTGWNYKGLVFQDVTENTVEEHIMRVMETAMLVNTREAAQWTRCGRTDQGVSAFRQVAAVTVRSTDTSADGVFWSMDSDPATRVHSSIEIPYVKLLNGNLPKSIRILAWCPTHRDFNARFNCQHRIYTYVFPRTHTDLALMNDGCSRLVGSHDFRNFCQIDKNRDRVQMCYLRRILEAKVEEVIDHPHPNRTVKHNSAEQPPIHTLLSS